MQKHNALATEPLRNWKEQAQALFFTDHLAIKDISEIVRRARETVSRFICSCEGYDEEMEFRSRISAQRRREYLRKWDKECRNRGGGETAGEHYAIVTAETIMNEHKTAVRVLSRERFFGD